MGLFGSIVGGAFKLVGGLANEVIKEATGVDIAAEIKPEFAPAAESMRREKIIKNRIKEFEANKEAFVEEYGIEEYELELEYMKDDLRENAQMGADEIRWALSSVKDNLSDKYEEYTEKKEKIEKMQRKIETMSDN